MPCASVQLSGPDGGVNTVLMNDTLHTLSRWLRIPQQQTGIVQAKNVSRCINGILTPSNPSEVFIAAEAGTQPPLGKHIRQCLTFHMEFIRQVPHGAFPKMVIGQAAGVFRTC